MGSLVYDSSHIQAPPSFSELPGLQAGFEVRRMLQSASSQPHTTRSRSPGLLSASRERVEETAGAAAPDAHANVVEPVNQLRVLVKFHALTPG